MRSDGTTLRRFRIAIQEIYGRHSVHVASVPIHEVVEGQTVWQGTVEVFSLIGDPAATTVYVWGRDPAGTCCATVLGLDPITSPQDAVRADIAADVRSKLTRH